MDATQKIEMSQDFSTYAEKHEIYPLFQSLMKDVLVNMPEDPLQFLIEKLELPADIANLPKVIVTGPPCSGKYTLCNAVAEKLHCVHIVAKWLPDADKTGLGAEAKKLEKTGKSIPPQLWADMFQARINQEDCQRKGWIISGFPQTRSEAAALQRTGVIPTHYFSLTMDAKLLEERLGGRLIDPRTGDVYHSVLMMPKDAVVAKRLVQESGYTLDNLHQRLGHYKTHSPAVDRSYQQCAYEVSADQPHTDVRAEVLTILGKRLRNDAPRTPHLVIFGPYGAGKSTQAALLADKYLMVNVSCDQLIKQEVTGGTQTGRAMQTYVDKGISIPDELVLNILKRRLSQKDCQGRGWVLHGFPKTGSQAHAMERAGFVPDRVVYLNIPEGKVIERLSNRRVDPVTGERYHLITKVPEADITARLVTHPDDEADAIRKKLQLEAAKIEDLKDYYLEKAVEVEGSYSAQTVMEGIEEVLVYPMQKEEIVITDLTDDE
eukprot:scpid47239/ scgid25718/ Adenylate kinase 8